MFNFVNKTLTGNRRQTYDIPHNHLGHEAQTQSGLDCATNNDKLASNWGKWGPWSHEEELNYQNKKRQEKMKEEKERKVRIVLCIYALLGLALCQMSRMVLNVAIVEMVSSQSEQGGQPIELRNEEEYLSVADQTESTTTTPSGPLALEYAPTTLASVLESAASPETRRADLSIGPIVIPVAGATGDGGGGGTAGGSTNESHNDLDGPVDIGGPLDQSTSERPMADVDNVETGKLEGGPMDEPQVIHARRVFPKFNWSTSEQSLLLGAFYMGYFPFMFISGFLAEKYGAKYIIFVGVAGSSLVNILTPIMADLNFPLLVVSRIVMGAMQAGTYPALYALFSKWLTMTETSIFAPMIKVALASGVLFGSLLPGILIGYDLGWPSVFYTCGLVCLLWSILWYTLSNSTPQESRFVGGAELARIMKKKEGGMGAPDPPTSNEAPTSAPNGQKFAQVQAPSAPAVKESTPWLLIFSSPSVLSLILVKLTYNMCLDFAIIELASYLKNVHEAPVEVISAITVCMFTIQALLVVFVGMLAKNMTRNRPFGWSLTTIRKVFQGFANFTMAFGYLVASVNHDRLWIVAALFQLVAFAWMFGAGGETMMPYDLSEKYPATIVGVAHSASCLSGVIIASLTGYILGDRGTDPAHWNLVLQIVGGSSVVGALIFILVAKAKPIEGSRSQADEGAQPVDHRASSVNVIQLTSVTCDNNSLPSSQGLVPRRGSVQAR